MRFSSKLVSLSLFCLFNVAHAQDFINKFDVIGIRMGMTVDQVRTAIQTANPKFKQTQEFNFTASPGLAGGGVAALVFADPKETDKETVKVQFTQTGGNVYYITRAVTTNGTATQEAILNGITSKYGQPHNVVKNVINWGGFWNFTDKGEKRVGGRGNECLPGQGGRPPNETQDGCNLAVLVLAEAKSSDQSINSFYAVYATDHRLMLKDIKASNAAAKAAKDAADSAALKAAKSGPAQKF